MKKILFVPFLFLSFVCFSQQKIQTPKFNSLGSAEPKDYYEFYTKQMEVLGKIVGKKATGYTISENSNITCLTIVYLENGETKETSFEATNKQFPYSCTNRTVDSICKRIHPFFLRNNY